MRQTRSFVVAAIAAFSLLLAASVGVAAHDLASSSSGTRQAAPAPAGVFRQSTADDATPNRAPFALIGLASLGAGAILLRRAPKLV